MCIPDCPSIIFARFPCQTHLHRSLAVSAGSKARGLTATSTVSPVPFTLTSRLQRLIGTFLLGAIILISALINTSIAANAAVSNPDVAGKTSAGFAPSGVFGSLEFLTNATGGIEEWHRVLARMEAEQPIYKLCDVGSEKCPKYLLDWRSKLNLWSKDDEQAQLREVND